MDAKSPVVPPMAVIGDHGARTPLVGARHTIQMLKETYQPGGDTGPEMLSHEAEEAGIVISGVIEVTVGDQQRVLNPGDGYLFDSRLPHRFRNIGNTECVVVSACTPPTF